jgi:hypothetical protein
MITTINNRRTFHVTGDNPRLLEKDLNAAVASAEARAKEDGTCVVLGTRHGTASFTVTADVRYGATEEACRIL